MAAVIYGKTEMNPVVELIVIFAVGAVMITGILLFARARRRREVAHIRKEAEKADRRTVSRSHPQHAEPIRRPAPCKSDRAGPAARRHPHKVIPSMT